MQHKIYEEFAHFQKKHLFKNDKPKNMSCVGTTITFFTLICKRFCSKIHLYEKNIFGQKNMQSLFDDVGSFYLVCTHQL
jgi:hypothetical protein